MIITHNGTILKHDGTILTKITEVPPQPPFTNTYSLEFDGVDDFIDVGSINLGNTFTLSAWVKLNGFSSTQNTVFGGGNNIYAIYIPNSTTIYFNFGSGFALFTVPTILTSTWYNIIFTRNGSNGEVFVNGISQGTTTALGANNFTVNFLGCENQGVSTKYYFNGNIDEPCIFDRVVTPTEIVTLSTAPTLDLTDLNPIAWYRNGDNGSWKSPQWLIPNNENKDKVSNYSMAFDGVDDYLNLGNGVSFEYTDSFSYSFWVNPNAVSGAKYLYAKYDPALGRGVIIYLNSASGAGNNTLYFLLLNTNSGSTATRKRITTNTGAIISPSVWTNIVITYDGSGLGTGINVYKNGVSQTVTVTQDNLQNSTIVNTQDSYLSSYNGISSFFTGKQDEFSIYNSKLSQADVDSIYNSGEPTTISGAVAHYKMGEEANFTSNWLVDNSISPNRALKFDNTYVTSPPWSGYQGLRASTTAISSNHITLSTWFKSTDSGNNQGEIFKTSLYNIKVYANRVYLFKAGALYRYWNSSDLFNGSWHNIIIYIPNTATWDLADAKIYVDGVDLGVGTGIGDGTGVSQITDIYGLFKTGGGGGGTMTAEISNWAYWLSDKRDDVSTIYNNGVPGDLSSLSPNVWWKLDSGTVTTDTQVDVIDSSGNNVTGTGPRNAAKTIPVLVSSTVNSRPPYSKRSFVFDGMGDKIELSTQSLGLTGAISVSAWVKIPTTNTGGGGTNIQQIVCEDRAGGTGRNWLLYWRGGSQNVFACAIFDSLGTSTSASSTAVVPNDNQWHHVMFTYSGDTTTNGLKLFVDGILRSQGTSANGGLRSSPTVKPTIGGLSNVITWMFEGNIDEVSIFNTDQSANVSTIYNDGIPNDLTELSPLHWYRMGEDASFNGTNWTVPDNVGSNDGTSDGMMVDALVGEAPNYSGGGISEGMDIEDRVGNAPNSENNALSYNMEREDRVEDTPSTT